MSDLSNLVARLEAATARLESLGVSGKGSAPAAAAGAADEDGESPYDTEVGPLVDAFQELGSKVGGEAGTGTQHFCDAFAALREFIQMASQHVKPADNGASLVSGIVAKMTATSEVLGKNPRTKDADFLKALEEAVNALGWVLQTPKPVPFINGQIESTQFWSNKVMKNFKDSDKNKADWAKSLIAVLNGLKAYVKSHHTTGLTWNPRGKPAPKEAPAAKPAAAKPAAAQPAAAKPAGGAGAALFSDLSKGSAVTSGLKKVERSEMTHKNKDLRATSVVKAEDAGPKGKVFTGGVKAVKKDPVFEYNPRMNRWEVEHQVNNSTLVVEPEATHKVSLYKCEGSTVQVKGKCNAILVDGCKKTAIVFESLVASVDVVNCQSIKMQVTGKVPTINIDKTDGVQVFLSKDSQDVSIVSAKSSEMNVSVPPESDDGDWIEYPLPEQYQSVYDPVAKAFTTTTIKHE